MDNASTSFPKPSCVTKAIEDYINTCGSNVNRGSYTSAYEAEEIIMKCRQNIASFFGCENPRNVIFTSGATMGMNMVLLGMLSPGDHVLVSGMEHNAVMRPLTALMQDGIAYDTFQNAYDLKGKIGLRTKCIVMLHGSNINGEVFDVERIGELAMEAGCYFVVDASQTAGHIGIDFEKIKADALVFSGHKGLMGPQGIGVVIMSERMARKCKPLIYGGTGSRSATLDMPEFLPDKFEAGTLNIPGIIGLNAAIDHINSIGIDEIFSREKYLTRLLIQKLSGLEDEGLIRIISSADKDIFTPIVLIVTKKIDVADAARRLDEYYGVQTRVGLHCAPCAHKALGTFPEGGIRFSLGFDNTEEDINMAVDALYDICHR